MRFSLRRLGVLALLATGALQSCDEPSAPTSVQSTSSPAASQSSEVYVVLFKRGEKDAPGLAQSLVTRHRGRLRRVFEGKGAGFSAELSPAEAAALARHPSVRAIADNRAVFRPGMSHTTQFSAPWSLDRIDQRNLPLDGRYESAGGGTGVRVYILDSGIRANHNQFGNRVLSGYSVLTDGHGTNDCYGTYGHGTAVASAVGGSTYGVAKNVYLVPVRILGCGFDTATPEEYATAATWILNNHVKPAIVNVSMSATGAPGLVDSLTQEMVDDGLVVVAMAGNHSGSTCDISPARVSGVIAVASMNRYDGMVNTSGYGSCVDMLAPGADVVLAARTSNSATATWLGTSFASPQVAGAAAIFMQANPTATPQQVVDTIVAASTKNVVAVYEDTPSRLLYWRITPHFHQVQNLTQTPVSGGVQLNWNRVLDASGYIVDVVVVYEEYNDYEGTSNVYDYTEWGVATVYDTTVVDTFDIYSGLERCTLWANMYGSASYAYFYRFTPLYGGPVTRLTAQIAPTGSCP